MKKKYRIHPIFSDLIPTALSACDEILFDSRTSCPHCGGSLARYDVKTKHFADIIDGSNTRTITVRIKRFRCRECHAVIYADQPFYPNTRVGSPVVDLCVTLSARMPYARASTFLQQIGVSCRPLECPQLCNEKYQVMFPRQNSTASYYRLPLSPLLRSHPKQEMAVQSKPQKLSVPVVIRLHMKKSDGAEKTLKYLLTGFLSEVFIYVSFYSFC